MAPKRKSLVKNLVGLAAVARVLWKHEHDPAALDERGPAVLTSERLGIIGTALDLAADGRQDSEAIESLRELAREGGSEDPARELRRLAAGQFQERITFEEPVNNLAARLLAAAGGDGVVQPPTPDARHRLALVAELYDAGPENTFNRLTEYSPGLRQVRDALDGLGVLSVDQQRAQYRSLRIPVREVFMTQERDPDPELPDEFATDAAKRLCLEYLMERIDPSGDLLDWVYSPEGRRDLRRPTPESSAMLKRVLGKKPRP